MRLAGLIGIVCLLWGVPAFAISIEKVQSPKGIEAWLVQDHSNPIISVSVAFRGGAVLDPDDKSGLAAMVAALLDEGAGEMDSQVFQARLRDLAISLSFSATQDAFYGWLKTTTDNEDEAFRLFRLALTEPRFDPDAVERIRSQMLANLASQLQDPEAIAGRAFARLVYPDHPYGAATDGVPDTVGGISVKDIRSFAQKRLAQDNLVVSVVGDITPERLKTLLDKTFGALPEKAEPTAVAEATPRNAGRVEIIRRPIPQSVAMFGQEGVKRNDPDWYAAYVMNYILGGGGFSSRLMTEIRVKRGLSYGVYTYMSPGVYGGLISGTVSSRNDLIAQSLQLIRSEWEHMAKNNVTPQELADAKTYLIGSFPLQMDSTQNIAALLTAIQIDDLGVDYIEKRNELINAVSVEDVARVAARLLNAGQITAIVVGDPQGL